MTTDPHSKPTHQHVEPLFAGLHGAGRSDDAKPTPTEQRPAQRTGLRVFLLLLAYLGLILLVLKQAF